MPETNIILWTFENYKGDYLFPQTSLNQVFLSENSPTIRVAQGGVMKRAYVPHDITQVFGKFDNAHIPDPDEYALEDIHREYKIAINDLNQASLDKLMDNYKLNMSKLKENFDLLEKIIQESKEDI